MLTQEEKKNRRIGMFATIGIHALLLILFIFIAAWRQQIPPPEPVGMSINFGTSEQGFGDIQPENEQEPQPQEQEAPSEPVEEVQEVVEEVVDPTPVTQEAVVETVQDEGPVVVEKKEEVKEEVKEETKPVETKPVEEKKTEEVEEKVEEERKLEAVFTGPKTDKTTTETNQGQKEGTTGDQGQQEGTLYSQNQTGGAGEGFSHSFTGQGWGTEFELPDNKPEAEGVLEFTIRIDANGNINSIQFKKKIGNTTAETFYRDYIQRNMRFYRLQNTGNVVGESTGTVTLNLKVK